MLSPGSSPERQKRQKIQHTLTTSCKASQQNSRANSIPLPGMSTEVNTTNARPLLPHDSSLMRPSDDRAVGHETLPVPQNPCSNSSVEPPAVNPSPQLASRAFRIFSSSFARKKMIDTQQSRSCQPVPGAPANSLRCSVGVESTTLCDPTENLKGSPGESARKQRLEATPRSCLLGRVSGALATRSVERGPLAPEDHAFEADKHRLVTECGRKLASLTDDPSDVCRSSLASVFCSRSQLSKTRSVQCFFVWTCATSWLH